MGLTGDYIDGGTTQFWPDFGNSITVSAWMRPAADTIDLTFDQNGEFDPKGFNTNNGDSAFISARTQCFSNNWNFYDRIGGQAIFIKVDPDQTEEAWYATQ